MKEIIYFSGCDDDMWVMHFLKIIIYYRFLNLYEGNIAKGY